MDEIKYVVAGKAKAPEKQPTIVEWSLDEGPDGRPELHSFNRKTGVQQTVAGLSPEDGIERYMLAEPEKTGLPTTRRSFVIKIADDYGKR